MGWDERRTFNSTEPARDGLARLALSVVGAAAQVVELRRLRGGVDAATHAVRFDPGGWFVLKRAPTPRSRSLANEFDRLRFAQRTSVRTPTPVAVDVNGSWFGHPCLVMEFVPGESRFHEASGEWVDRLADTLAGIHPTPADAEAPSVLQEPHAGLHWEPAPPLELPRTTTVAALIAAGLSLRDMATSAAQAVLLHHDFHHGNVLWDGEQVTAVLDWNESRFGPRVCDVAYCGVDLAMTHGLNASKRFTASYAAATGETLDDLARWQCLWTANAMRWIKYWITGFHDAGIDLSVEQARERLDEYAIDVLDTL